MRDNEVLNVLVGVNDVECATDGDPVKDRDELVVFNIELDTEWDVVRVRVRDGLGVGMVGDKDGEDDLEWLPEALA